MVWEVYIKIFKFHFKKRKKKDLLKFEKTKTINDKKNKEEYRFWDDIDVAFTNSYLIFQFTSERYT